MKYEEIMQDITRQLTGDAQADLKFLMSKSEEYKTHELANEILRGIGRMLYDVIPPEARAEFGRVVGNEQLGVNAVLEEARFQMYSRNLDRALEILESLIKRIEGENGDLLMYRDDSVSEYHNFQDYLEELLYKDLYKPEKTIRQIPEDYFRLYFTYGNLLFELKQFEKARAALKKALKLNPVNTEAIFELAEIHKLHREWDEFLLLTKRCLSVAYSRMGIGRCYRNLGYYAIENKEYELAVALYFKSMEYDRQSTMPQSQIFYIQQVTGTAIPQLSSYEVNEVLERNNIPTGANNAVLGMSYGLGRLAVEQGQSELARYFLSILYELTLDKEVEAMIASLPVEKNYPA